MRICHITTVHPARDARIFYRMCRVLASRGLSVTLIAPEEIEDTLVRLSPWNGRLARASRPRRLSLALRAALAADAQIYHFHDPELMLVGFALKVLRPSVAVVYDVHEDYPAMMHVKYWIPRSLRPLCAAAVQGAHTLAGRYLDGIVTADPSVHADFGRVPGHKTMFYYNFPSLELFQAPAPTVIEKQADLIYLGGMSERAGIFVLLDALALLAQQGTTPSVRLAGYTDGEVGHASLVEGIQRRALEAQVQLCGRIPHNQVPTWLCGGRIGLVTLQPIAKFLKNIPSKLFEYWACGLPVIASDLPPIRPFLVDQENGWRFEPTSAADLARVIRWALEHPEACQAMGQRGRQQVMQSWNNTCQVEQLLQFYRRILRSTSEDGPVAVESSNSSLSRTGR